LECWYSRGWLKKVTMLKMLGKTNIDFIGPRYYCMAGSLILIVLGLIATAVRGQGIFNIDFTGGTLVTIRLNENDQTVHDLSDSRRAEFVREKAVPVLPDVTVESLRVSDDTRLTRFNIRTTDDKPEHVKQAVLDAFGPSLARVQMTYSEGKPIAAAPAAAPSDTAVARVASGREYELRFNTTAFNSAQSPSQVVSSEFVKVLGQAGITNPESRFEAKPAPSPTGSAGGASTVPTGTHLILRTDLEPEGAKAQLEKL